MKRIFPPLLASLLLASFLAACAPLAPAAPPAATASPQPTPTQIQAEAPDITPTPGADRSPLPAPTLFDTPWDDRSMFAAGLTTDAQDVLNERPGASIYHIDIKLADDLAQVDGREEVRYTNTEDVSLDRVVFRLFPNLADGKVVISNLTVNGAAVEPSYELDNSAMLVPLEPALSPGEQIVLGMDFAVTVPTEPGGNYGTFALVDGVLALAHFYPMIAVYDDEGWNAEIAPKIGDVVYSDSSYYLVRVDAPAGQNVLTSGVETHWAKEGDRETIMIAAGPMRDFYLVASERYEAVSEQVGETTISSYAPEDMIDEAKLALKYAVNAFKVYSQTVGPYPFTELEVAGTPTLAGGVEYPGIVVVALSIYDPDNGFFEAATAHEVGHQWFYSVVGNDQIDEPWLDESLTQYITMLYYADAYGSAGYNGFRDSLDRRWKRVDRADIPVGMPVARYAEDEYSAIVYGRGPLFFEALQETMGKAKFDAFLKDYYRAFSYDIVTTANLKQLAEQECGCDLTKMFKEWVYPQ